MCVLDHTVTPDNLKFPEFGAVVHHKGGAKETRSLCSNKPELLMVFRKGFYRQLLKEGRRAGDLPLLGSEVMGRGFPGGD